MSSPSPFRLDKLCDTDPLVSEVASAMITALGPRVSECVVVQHANHRTIGVHVPKDSRITLKQLYAGPKVCTKRVPGAWIEWNKKKECFVVCCKLLRASRAPPAIEDGDGEAETEKGSEVQGRLSKKRRRV